MKRKVTSLKVKSFRGDEYTFYPMKGNGFDKTYLRQVFSDEEIAQIENDFNQFYKLVSANCIDEQAKKLLKSFQKELKSTYYMYMWESILSHPSRHSVNAGDESIKSDLLNDKQLRDTIILGASMKLFFLADVVIAFVMGNDERLRDMKEELERRRNERRKHDYKILEKMKEIEDSEKPKPTQFQLLIKANRIIKKYNESELIDTATGKPTQLAVNYINNYKTVKN